MKEQITYKLIDHVINPKYIGLIREYMPEDYELDKYASNPIPELVTEINNFFSDPCKILDNSELFDCSSENDIYTIDFRNLNLDDRTMLYFFFCVQCDSNTDVVFTIESHAIQRLWLNGKMVCLCGQGQRQIHTLHLKQGNNVFCFQQHDAVIAIKTTFRIRSLEADKKDVISLTNGNLYYKEGLIGISVLYLNEFRYNGEDYKFVIYPIDYVNLSEDIQIHLQIVDHISGKVLYNLNCRFHEFYSVPTSEFKYSNESIFNYLDVKFKYCTIFGDKKEEKLKIYLIKPDNYITPVQERARKLLAYDRADEERLYLEYILSLTDNSDDIKVFHKWERIEKVISIIERGSYYSYIRSEGEKVICFRSDIDDTIDYYTITLPSKYDLNRKYPLLIINNVLQGSWLSSYFSRAKNVEAITVDFSGRGITMGSYVGDAAFNEIYKDVFSKYSIDETKICMLGHSNGGYATWAQALVAPDRYSAIFPAVSEPNEEALMNLSNMSVRYLTSESDYLNFQTTDEIEKEAKSYIKDYKTIWVEKYNHSLFGQIQFSEKVIGNLLSKTKNKFPDEVYFYTDKNRYRKSYWITIHSIEFGKTYAKVHAKIVGNSIEISAENISGITVDIPPQIDGKNITIMINGKTIGVLGIGKIILINTKNGFVLEENESNGNLYKGTGLIDPFVGAVRIINFLGDKHNEVLNNFCSPSTNGFYGGIAVKYPILDISSFESLPKTNFVVLDNCTGSGEIIEKIRDSASVKIGSNGFSYMGKSYPGKYLVMQIMGHPTEADNSVLYINTNDEYLYEKCFFTRKLILPAYSSGYYTYLNSNALIFDGKSYSVIPEFGCDVHNVSDV